MTSETMTPVTVRLAELRAAKGWTIDEMAKRSRVSRATIIRLEQHQTKQVRFDVLEKLARALECDPGYLIKKER
jgi:putative transcriptional regulator